MMIPPETVIVKKRLRRDLGDIDALMASLKKFGQLNPIIINRRYELLAGFRRLEAAKRLGWRSIEAIILDRETEDQKLEMEIEENVQRHDLSPEELSEGLQRLHRLQHPGLLLRIWRAIAGFFRALFTGRRLLK